MLRPLELTPVLLLVHGLLVGGEIVFAWTVGGRGADVADQSCTAASVP